MHPRYGINAPAPTWACVVPWDSGAREVHLPLPAKASNDDAHTAGGDLQDRCRFSDGLNGIYTRIGVEPLCGSTTSAQVRALSPLYVVYSVADGGGRVLLGIAWQAFTGFAYVKSLLALEHCPAPENLGFDQTSALLALPLDGFILLALVNPSNPPWLLYTAAATQCQQTSVNQPQ